MKTMNNPHDIVRQTQFHSMVFNELLTMPIREVSLIWEIIKVMKQNQQPEKKQQNRRNFDFKHSQSILKNLKGSLSEDIINIEREDRI